MHLRYLTLALACALGSELSQAQSATAASALSEQDFLADVPIVLSVSRLAQRLDETPGAMTILDRDFIRRSGARDVVELLRFVPGFFVSTTFETDAPMAYYHGKTDDWANRLQLLVDGRSVYSSFLQGSVGLGFQTLALEDIERIEVLRGSNSAAYGSRAFLGVVNIVSRAPEDTKQSQYGVTAGENGVADVFARTGWDSESSASRISVDSRGDDGLRKTGSVAGAKGNNRVSRVNFSSHVKVTPSMDVSFRSGLVDLAAYRGDVKSPGNFERLRFMDAAYAQADASWVQSADEEFGFQLSRTVFQHRDNFPFYDSSAPANYQGVMIDWSGQETNDVLGFQFTKRQSPSVRYVVGAELRQEQMVSSASFYQRDSLTSQSERVFGNVEWRPQETWVINGGAHFERIGTEASVLSPRLMANWHVLPGQTLRAGVSTAFRQPSMYEKYADRRYFDASGTLLLQSAAPNLDLRAEKVLSRELGYFFGGGSNAVSADVRLYHEYISDGISHSLATPDVYLNSDNYDIRGGELQLAWQVRSGTRLAVSWARSDITANKAVSTDATFRTEYSAPKSIASLAWMQSLGSWDLSLLYSDASEVALMSSGSSHLTSSYVRTDVRLARKFKWSGMDGEIAATVQNVNAPYADGDRKFLFDRRGIASLRLEY